MSKEKRPPRAPRFVVPNNEQALLTIGAERTKGVLHLLSMTGGSLRLQKRYPVGTFADIGIKASSGTVAAAIELLQTRGINEQAFRFVAMGPVARGRLTESLGKMRAQGLAVQKSPMDHFRSLAQRVFPMRAAK